MLNPLNLISKIFKSSNEKELSKLAKPVNKINALEDQSSKLGDGEFPKKTQELKQKFIDGVKLICDNGWVAYRLSGTEPLLRIYSESDTQSSVDALIAYVRTFLGV